MDALTIACVLVGAVLLAVFVVIGIDLMNDSNHPHNRP